MSPEAQRRLGHPLQAIRSIQAYTADAPLPELESLLAACAGMRDWQHPVPVEELVGFVAGDLQVWQGRLMAGAQMPSPTRHARLVGNWLKLPHAPRHAIRRRV